MNHEEILVLLKRKEIEALERKQGLRDSGDDYWKYFDGLAEGFARSWEFLLNSGETMHPVEYNKWNDIYSRKVAEQKAA